MGEMTEYYLEQAMLQALDYGIYESRLNAYRVDCLNNREWITARGETVSVDNMSSDHIRNCLKFLDPSWGLYAAYKALFTEVLNSRPKNPLKRLSQLLPQQENPRHANRAQ